MQKKLFINFPFLCFNPKRRHNLNSTFADELALAVVVRGVDADLIEGHRRGDGARMQKACKKMENKYISENNIIYSRLRGTREVTFFHRLK
jgi:hypothetical protein